MADHSHIEWTEATWNPVTGCTKVSPGCKNCYADRMAKRLQSMGAERYRNGFELTLHPDVIMQPLSWKRPRTIFVNSMSDLFHEDVPIEFIQDVFRMMGEAHWHTFQILTKRASRLAELAPSLNWAKNIWMGVSIENQDYVHRADNLRNVPAAVRFLSLEPLIGSITDINLSGIDWVIVGGESGPKCRSLDPDWVRILRDKCVEEVVPFFFKQWGGTRKKKNGRLLDGRIWDEMPQAKERLIRAKPAADNSAPYEHYAHILCKHTSTLRDRFNVKRIGIFGSYVRGEQRRRSDLDILVEYSIVPDLLTFIELEMHLSELLEIKVDLVRKEGIRKELRRQILDEVVYL
jgi:protein gp37/predicted nucleotidyltransferase